MTLITLLGLSLSSLRVCLELALPFLTYFIFFRILQLAAFVSDLGGSLGLWIGMSVLSFAEIFELLVLMCLSLGKKLKKRKNTTSSTIHVEEFDHRS